MPLHFAFTCLTLLVCLNPPHYKHKQAILDHVTTLLVALIVTAKVSLFSIATHF